MAALVAAADVLALGEPEVWEHSSELASGKKGEDEGADREATTGTQPSLEADQEEEEEEEEEEDEREEEEDVLTDATTGAQPSLEAACRMDRMLSSASTAAAAWLPQALDDTLWEEDDDEGFSGWTPWSPASFEMTENRSSGTPSTMTMRVGISSQ